MGTFGNLGMTSSATSREQPHERRDQSPSPRRAAWAGRRSTGGARTIGNRHVLGIVVPVASSTNPYGTSTGHTVSRARAAKSLYNTSDPGGSRTRDLRIKSPLLYQLSYRVGFLTSSKKLVAFRFPLPLDTEASPSALDIPILRAGQELITNDANDANRSVRDEGSSRYEPGFFLEDLRSRTRPVCRYQRIRALRRP